MRLDDFRTLIVAIDTSTDMLACSVAWWTPEVFFDDRPSRACVDVLATRDHLCRRHANVELVETVRRALEDAGKTIADVGGFLVGRGPGSFTGVRIGISTAKGLARGLVETVRRALEDAGKTIADVGGFLVGRGPGSFTGVRIGISTAKGLARGANVPLMGVSTLDACAWTAWRSGVRGLLGVAADAMRGEVYPALYRVDDEGPHRMFERERVVKAAVAVEEWSSRADAGEIQVTGDGLVRHGGLFEGAGLMGRALDRELWWPSGEGLLLAAASPEGLAAAGDSDPATVLGLFEGAGLMGRALDRELWWPSGEGLLLAAASPEGLAAAGDSDPATVLPVYTRLSDAEENERKRLGLAESVNTVVTGVADELAGRHLQVRPMAAADAEAMAALEGACFAGAGHDPWTASAGQAHGRGGCGGHGGVGGRLLRRGGA